MYWVIGGVIVLGIGILIAVIAIKDTMKEKRVRRQGKPVITAMVMANERLFGPDGMFAQGAGVVVFGFYDPSPKLCAALRKVAERAHALYEAEDLAKLSPACRQFAETIKDHDYTEGRRYRVPQEICGSSEIYAADLWIDKARLSEDFSETRMIACAITGSSKGEIVQLPPKDPAAIRLYAAVRGS